MESSINLSDFDQQTSLARTSWTSAKIALSICTLVTDANQYQTMLASFRERGFTEDKSEFLYIDNTQSNTFDAYSGIREFVLRASGEYIVVCHQDVELVDDGYDHLLSKLRSLDQLHPDWALAGNSGVKGLAGWAMRITDPLVTDASIGDLPAKVDSLDENFLVIRKSSLLAPSADLHGFHFYGLDLCLRAQLQGQSAYVIDFHLWHKSAGNRSPVYFECLREIEDKYVRLLRGRIIRTTCELVFIGKFVRLRPLRRFLKKLLRITVG